MEDRSHLIQTVRFDAVMISGQASLRSLLASYSQFLDLQTRIFSDLQEIQAFEQGPPKSYLIVLDIITLKGIDQFRNCIQQVKNFYLKSRLIVIVANDTATDEVQSIKAMGVNRVLFQSECENTVHLFVLISIYCCLEYLPVAINDLFPSTEIGFNIYSKLHLNRKYLPVIFEDFILSDTKFKKLENCRDVYIKRFDASIYKAYIEKFYDQFAKGLKKRQKASLYEVMNMYFDFKESLILYSESGTQERFNLEIENAYKIYLQLMNYFSKDPEVLISLYQFSRNSIFKFEPGFIICIFAGVFAKQFPEIDQRILFETTWLAYTGLYNFSLDKYISWLEDDSGQTPESLKDYPVQSLNHLISKSLKPSEMAVEALPTMAERFDGTGVPNQLPGDKVPALIFVIKIAEMFFRKIKNIEEVDNIYLQKLLDQVTHDLRASQAIPPQFEKIDLVKAA